MKLLNSLKKLAEPYWPHLELFLITGPSLIGWLVGTWRYRPGSGLFQASIQGFLIFSSYILLLILNHFVGFLFSFSDYVVYGDSFFCLAYLAGTIYTYSKALQGQPVTLPLSQRALQKINI